MEKQVEYNGKILSNDVHSDGTIMVKIEKTVNSFTGKLLGRKKIFSFPVQVSEAAEWKEDEQIKITVENQDCEEVN
jgi:hypothetical protein